MVENLSDKSPAFESIEECSKHKFLNWMFHCLFSSLDCNYSIAYQIQFVKCFWKLFLKMFNM